MKESTSKEKILKNVRNALISKQTNPYKNIEDTKTVFHPDKGSLDVLFAEEFSKLGGKFVYCNSYPEAKDAISHIGHENGWSEIFCFDRGLKNLIEDAGIEAVSDDAKFNELRVGASRCEVLVSRTGSVFVSSALPSGRKLNVYPEIHIIIAETSQLVYDIKDALTKFTKKYSQENWPSSINMISGPSRTADIEKTLVLGAHGPKEIYVFLVNR